MDWWEDVRSLQRKRYVNDRLLSALSVEKLAQKVLSCQNGVGEALSWQLEHEC